MSNPPDLSTGAIDPARLDELRGRAASQLAGAAAAKGSSARAIDALAVLHALASSPATASNALTLLHELQLHQVELDLQAQELRESRAELESALRRQVELYDLQPVGCFTLDRRGALIELNQTGAGMLGVARDEACGLPLGSFFSSGGELRFRSSLSSVDAGHASPSCVLELRQPRGLNRTVLASTGKDTATGHYLVNLASVSDEQLRQPSAH
jgi:PAS domain-containing protein